LSLARRPGFGSIARWWRGPRAASRTLSLALQGGGAHGAFTWGVLDALLDEPELGFEAFSGTSAGAMNAVVLADGWMRDGRDGARQALADFWGWVGRQLPATMVVERAPEHVELSPLGQWIAQWAGWFSPAQLNPLDVNPLRDRLAEQVDFDRLRRDCPFRLFIAATHVPSGRLRLFREHELTLEMLLASACLPTLHHTVVIDGEPYWDGGYAANPAVFPLVNDCSARDLLLVLLSPLWRDGTPHTMPEIRNRIVELAFSANFLREMRLFAEAAESARPGLGGLQRRWRAMRWHMIDASGVAGLQRTDTKLIAHGPFLEQLFEQGRSRASAWLAAHRADIGRRSTVDHRTWLD